MTRGPSTGERSTLEPYLREVGPLSTLTAEQEVALAKVIEVHTSALRQRRAALSCTRAARRGGQAWRALEREIGHPAQVFRARMREIGRSQRALREARNRFVEHPVSLDAPVLGAEEQTLGETIPDSIPARPVETIHRARLQREVKDLLAHLPACEAQVLRWRFGLPECTSWGLTHEPRGQAR